MYYPKLTLWPSPHDEEDDTVADDLTLNARREVEELYELYAADMLAYAESLAQGVCSAQDAVQECFLRYFTERSCGRNIENPRAWLYRVLRNYILDRLGASSAKLEVAIDRGLEKAGSAPGPVDLLEHAEAASQIAAMLSGREMECLRLRAQGCTYDEIAGILGIRIGTVSCLLTRVHKKLRKAGYDHKGPATGGLYMLILQGKPNAS
jgi:RNA polymerase sigma-70 factor (ECF subfamily)